MTINNYVHKYSFMTTQISPITQWLSGDFGDESAPGGQPLAAHEHKPSVEPLVVHGPAVPGLRYFTTTRIGGYSRSAWASFNLGAHCADNPEHVTQNRSRLQGYLPKPSMDIPWLQQVHGTAVAEVDYAGMLDKSQADAALTQLPHQAIAVLTADCLPIVICDQQTRILAVVHAGWRGLAQGVIEQTAFRLQQRCAVKAWWAWIGPAIGPQHFEVGPEVREAFVTQAPQDARYFKPGDGDRWWADLPALAQQRLLRSFTAPIAVHLSGCCSFADEEHFYSYRREATTGRMATVAWLMPD